MSADSIARVQLDFLHTELQTGHVLANIALSTTDEPRQISFIRMATVAYNTVLRFVGRVALTAWEAREVADGIKKLKYKLVAIGEKRWNIVGRRLDDRIHELAVKADEFPSGSPASHEIAELMKAEITEYFEREMNPPYQIDRRPRAEVR